MSASRGRLEQALLRAWRHRGPIACLLGPLGLLMWVLVGVRRFAWRQGCLSRRVLPVPVVVVGNRIAGGAGKTPTTLAVLAHLRQRGWRPGVLTRGYGVDLQGEHRLLDAATAGQWRAQDTGDEPMLLWRRSGVPIMIGRDRAAAGAALLAAHPEIDILVCDDGLQHLKLARDLEIVVFDERGAGNGWLLPAGPLRESIHTAPGAQDGRPALVLYNADAPSTALPGHLARRGLAPLVTLAAWQAASLNGPEASATTAAPDDAPPPRTTLMAYAGIAQPERFFQALRTQGWLVDGRALPDHADWRPLPWPADAEHVVVTEKDAVKLDLTQVQRERPATTVWVAALHFEPDSAFWAALDARLPAVPSPPPTA
ncbi:MAG: hypothetical protein RI907_681 [Pseudomonadota bacterium]